MINILQVREIKHKRDHGDFSLTGYNTRGKIKHTNKLNTESVLCSSNICVLCYFKIILRPRRNQLMMEANQKVQEINVKLNECKPKSEIKSRSKSWYVLEVEKQKSSQIGSVLTVNLFWYFSWKRGQHGSWWKPCCCWQQFSRWGKVRPYQIFFMIITVWYYNSNRDL